MGSAEDVRLLADEVRAIAAAGLHWEGHDPHSRARYERLRMVSARLFALADTRNADQIERSLFTELTHLTPLPGGDAAVFNNDGQILLIQRADDALWAMPGGFLEIGETPAEGVARETAEEAGIEVEVTDLIGVYDSRFCETKSSLQLYQFVFLCRPIAEVTATTPGEVLDVQWFDPNNLPDLSPGHTVRVPDAIRFRRDRLVKFDRLNGPRQAT